MSVASLGVVVAAMLCVITTPMSRDPGPTVLFASSILVYICFATVALVRREFHSTDQGQQYRWKKYLWTGLILASGSLLVIFGMAASRQVFVPPTSRIMMLGFGTSVSLITAGSIVRYYILPLSVAVQAAYVLGERDLKTIKKLTNGNIKLASDVADTIERIDTTEPDGDTKTPR